ncbi:IKKgamma [Frankliniella occidentalis]|nr:IKKgamma [Frankliniella occidentalis]
MQSPALSYLSLSNMSFGPPSSVSEADADHSFIVLDRMTADDNEKIVQELTASVCAFKLDTNLGDNVAFPNHFGENPVSTPPGSVSCNGELLSDSSDALPSEVRHRMNSLIQENSNLQVTVNQTNVALKQLMMTLEQCKGDMDRVRQDHKEKFQETRDLVLKLKKEKADMRIIIEELQAKIEELQHQPTPSLFEAVDMTVNEFEFKSKIDDLQSQLSIAEASNQAEREKSALYLEELNSLKQHVNVLENKSAQFEALQKEVEKQNDLLRELSILGEENLRLKNDVKNLSSVERHSQEYQFAQAKGFTQRVDELTAKLMCTEEQLAKAKSEVAQLKSFEIVQMKSLESSSGSHDEALNNARATVDRLRLRIDEMTAKIVELDQKCENQAQEISSLQHEKVRQSEAVGILQAQVEVYRSDFIAERDCRERLAGEKEQLAEDLRRLHRHNLELMESRNVNAAQGGETVNRNVELPAEETQNSYRCPICQIMTFRTLQGVNEHIDRCLGDASMS